MPAPMATARNILLLMRGPAVGRRVAKAISKHSSTVIPRLPGDSFDISDDGERRPQVKDAMLICPS